MLIPGRILSSTGELIEHIDPVIRGWGLYFCKARVRKLSTVLRPGSCDDCGCTCSSAGVTGVGRGLPERRLSGEYGRVKPVSLGPFLEPSSLSDLSLYNSGLRPEEFRDEPLPPD